MGSVLAKKCDVPTMATIGLETKRDRGRDDEGLALAASSQAASKPTGNYRAMAPSV